MNTHDDLTTRLNRQFHDQVDGWHDSPLTLESVRGRAHAIRRTRRLAAAGVAAVAVAAIAIPAGLVGSGMDRTQREPSPIDTPTEAVDEAPTPRADGTFPLAPLAAPEGEAPLTGYLRLPDDTLVTADGERQLPEGTVQLERFGDGWLAAQSGEFPATMGTRLLRLDADLEVLGTVPATMFVVDEAGEHAAWIEVDGQQRELVQADPGGELSRTEVGSEAQVIGHLAGDRVVLQDPDYETGKDSFAVVGVDGEVTPFGGLVRLVSASETSSQVSAMTKYGLREVCYAVLEPTSGTRAFESCDYEPGTFSPDGSLVTGFTAGDDGLGSPELVVLDATTGEPVVAWSNERGDRSPALVQAVQWEDDDTLVATVTEGTEQTVIRVGLDGSMERVADPVRVQMTIALRLPQSTWSLQ